MDKSGWCIDNISSPPFRGKLYPCDIPDPCDPVSHTTSRIGANCNPVFNPTIDQLCRDPWYSQWYNCSVVAPGVHPPRVLPTTGYATGPISLLGVAFLVAGVALRKLVGRGTRLARL